MIRFTTGGFRGIIGKDFIPENIVKIATGIYKYINEKQYKKEVSLSYDFRAYSEETANLIAEVLSAAGIKVYLSDDATPTPVAMYMARYLNISIGMMITASHNPYNYNGIKLFEHGVDASEETTNHLEKLINEPGSLNKRDTKEVVKIDFLSPYFNFVKKFIDITPDAQNKILVDFIHGTGVKTIPYFKRYYNLVHLEFLRGEQTPNFNYILPNPLEEVIGVNRELQKEKGYELIMGLDSDADRLGMIDEHGNFVDNNEILAVIYYYLVKYRNMSGDIVKNIATSNLIDAVAKKLKYKAHTVDVGFKNISAGMMQHDALIGGESSGGMTIRDYVKGKDSTLSALLMIEIVTKLAKPLSQIVEEVRKFANFYRYTKEADMVFDDRNKLIDFLNKKTNLPFEFKQVIQYKSNYKYVLENDEWILLRFSGTEPLLRIFVETNDVSKSESIIESLKNILKGIW